MSTTLTPTEQQAVKEAAELYSIYNEQLNKDDQKTETGSIQ